jgi:hypothetical protein
VLDTVDGSFSHIRLYLVGITWEDDGFEGAVTVGSKVRTV